MANRSKTAKPVTVKVDATLKRLWARAHESLQKASNDGMHAFDRKYEALGDILDHDPPLYLAGGYATARAFLSAEVGENERSARRNVRVARYASPEEEERYTPSKIDAAIDLLEAKLGAPPKGRIPVDFAKLRIPVDGEKTKTIPFSEATVAQVRAAKRALAKTPKKASPVVRELRKVLPKEASAVTLHYGDGKVSLGHIPVRVFQEVMRALAKAKLPTDG